MVGLMKKPEGTSYHISDFIFCRRKLALSRRIYKFRNSYCHRQSGFFIARISSLTSSSSVATQPLKSQLSWRSLLLQSDNKKKNLGFPFVLCSLIRNFAAEWCEKMRLA